MNKTRNPAGQGGAGNCSQIAAVGQQLNEPFDIENSAKNQRLNYIQRTYAVSKSVANVLANLIFMTEAAR